MTDWSDTTEPRVLRAAASTSGRGSSRPTARSAATRRGRRSSPRRRRASRSSRRSRRRACAAAAARDSRPGVKWSFMPRNAPGAEIRRLQLRRERARHLPRPRHPALQPARAHRGHGDRRLRDGRHGRLQLHPRRIPRRAGAALRGGAEGSLCGRPARQEHPRLGRRLRPPHVRGRRRLHLRRRNGAARVARRQAGQAALQAAVPGQLRPVRQAHDDQQHAELCLGADDPAQGRRSGSRASGRRTPAAR